MTEEHPNDDASLLERTLGVPSSQVWAARWFVAVVTIGWIVAVAAVNLANGSTMGAAITGGVLSVVFSALCIGIPVLLLIVAWGKMKAR